MFYESYTSPVIRRRSHKRIIRTVEPRKSGRLSKREFVEDGRKILESAKLDSVALIASGRSDDRDDASGTSNRAMKEGIETKIIHGSSVLSAVVGELGLHSYNFGRPVTMTREPMQYTAYNAIFNNLLKGLHTTVLLEWDEAHNFFLEPKAASTVFSKRKRI